MSRQPRMDKSMTKDRKLTYFIAATIDGFIAGPGRGDPAGPSAFWPLTHDYIQFLATQYPETLPAPARDALGIAGSGNRFDTVLEGRRSYELGIAAGTSDAYPHLRHLVFSRTLESLPNPSVELVRRDPVERVRSLKQEAGKGIWIIGGGSLASSLRSEIDELIVKLGPITIGSGVPLWGTEARFKLDKWRRTDVVSLPDGTTVLSFQRTNGSSSLDR